MALRGHFGGRKEDRIAVERMLRAQGRNHLAPAVRHFV